MFERFLATKFPASKRFGLEGTESVMPGLYMFCEASAQLGVNHMQIGMSHRGRLNVLHNLLGKPLGAVCSEMEGQQSPFKVGDVKYHLGMTAEKQLASGSQMTVSLAPNPSHLEMIHPVVQGLVRALQRHRRVPPETPPEPPSLRSLQYLQHSTLCALLGAMTVVTASPCAVVLLSARRGHSCCELPQVLQGFGGCSTALSLIHI